MVQLARTCYEGLAWLWEKVRALFVKVGFGLEELSVPSQIVHLLFALKKHSRMLSGIVDTLLSPITQMGALRNSLLKVDSWASRYPRVRTVFEEIAFAAQCIVVAFGEELVKRWTPVGFSAMFGAIEALLATVTYHLDHDASRESIAKSIATAVAHVVCHTILRLLPMWVAVPVHALYNYLVGRGKSRWWNDLIELCQLDVLEYELDTFEAAPVSLPMNAVAQSQVYLKEPDGTLTYIKDDPQFLQLVAVREVSKKVIAVVSDATRILIRPSGSILDMVLMTVSRLDKPLPYVADAHYWNQAMVLFVNAFVEPQIDRKGHLRVLSPDQLIEYVEQRPWGNQRKEETITIIRKWASECKLKRPSEVTPKIDEIIPTQPLLVEPLHAGDIGVGASKTRPICPRAEADLKSMAIAVPLKHWMKGHNFWKLGEGRFEPVEDPEMELDFMLSIDYQMAPRADLLSAWFNRCRRFHGLHFAMHGDDQYALYVDINGEMLACAIDLSMCDKTCGELFQLNFCSFVNLASDDTHTDDVQSQFNLLVGEFQLKSRHFPMGTPPLFWNKKDRCTNTGEPLTSVKAVFAQFAAIFMTVLGCYRGGKFVFTLYRDAVMRMWRGLGLIPEFETNRDGDAWHHPSAVTYLGGMFVERVPDSCDDWSWVSNKHLKAYMVFPAVEKIYGSYHPMEQHMCVLLQDPDLYSGPVGRALARWYQRCCNATFENFEEVSMRAQLKYQNHLEQQDRYKLELMHDAGDYKAPVVADESYYHAAEHMLARNGTMYCADDIRKIEREIESFGPSPVQELHCSALPLYVLRFGNPKASPDDSTGQGLAELNIVGAIFDLSAKIFTCFNENMTKSKMSKAKASNAKKNPGPKKGGNKQPKKAFAAPQLHFAPVAIGASFKKSKPVFTKSADSQRIVHREKIAKATSPGTGVFTILKTIALNPGVAASFPWLANEAAGYESYKFNRLRFVWIPSIGSAVAGNVVMGPDYDAADVAPTGETALSSYKDTNEERIWCPLTVECDPKYMGGGTARKYVRLGNLGANQDIKTYDSGNLYLATSDDAAAQSGKLWVEYDVSLFNPQVPPGGFFQTATVVGLTATTSALLFGTAGTEQIRGAPSVSVSGNVVTVNGSVIGQTYFMMVEVTGTVASVLTAAYTSGCTASTTKNSLVNAGATEIATMFTGVATAETMVFTLACTATTVTASRFICTVEAPSAF